MSHFGRQRILESFAKARGVPRDDVTLVDAHFRKTETGTEVTLGLPLQGAMSLPGDIGDVMTGKGKDFVIQAFETASGRTVRPGNWMMAVHDTRSGQSDGEAGATYIMALYPEMRGYHRRY
jgi:hypothetical protein